VSPSPLLQSIANTLADYRQGEIAPIDAAHVDRWISQFDPAVHTPMLEELDHVLKETYFSKAKLRKWLGMLASAANFVGTDPPGFWSNTTTLRLQSRGTSQGDVSSLLEQEVAATWGVTVGATPNAGSFLYLDDFIFTGNTAVADLSAWITNTAPHRIDLRVVVVAVHTYGEYYLRKQLEKAAAVSGKSLSLSIWRSGEFEDRKSYINASEVFRPTRAAGDPHVDAYVAQLVALNRPPILRAPGAMPTTGVFASPTSRDILEWELLRAGATLRAGCANPKRVMRPLGFSTLDTLGFGATVVTYRNCPNNAPLALWWGDPTAVSGALAWYPLLPRRPPASTPAWRVAPGSSFASLLQRFAVASVPVASASAPGQQLRAAAPAASVAAIEANNDLEDDEHDMPWETDAEGAVWRVLESLDVDEDDGVVRVEVDEGWIVLEDIEQLRSHLEAAYNEGWYANVPFDGGEAVFEGDPTNTVEDALTSIANELATLGWET